MFCFISLRILTGILFGPDDLVAENESTISETSSGVVRDIKKEVGFRFLRKCEKRWLVDGIVDLTLSAIDVKKSLKRLATVSGSEDTELPTEMDIGLDDLESI
jgi:hypothetical protein